MSSNTELKSDSNEIDVLPRKIVSLYDLFKDATDNTIRAAQYLNEFSCETVKSRNTMFIGRENAPQLVSIKQLSDHNTQELSTGDFDAFNQESIQKSLSTAKDNLHCFEDQYMSTNQFMQSLEHCMKYFKDQGKLVESPKPTDSDISSFLEKDVVTSSPYNSHAENDAS